MPLQTNPRFLADVDQVLLHATPCLLLLVVVIRTAGQHHALPHRPAAPTPDQPGTGLPRETTDATSHPQPTLQQPHRPINVPTAHSCRSSTSLPLPPSHSARPPQTSNCPPGKSLKKSLHLPPASAPVSEITMSLTSTSPSPQDHPTPSQPPSQWPQEPLAVPSIRIGSPSIPCQNNSSNSSNP